MGFDRSNFFANSDCYVREGKVGDIVGVTALGMEVLPYNGDGNVWGELLEVTHVHKSRQEGNTCDGVANPPESPVVLPSELPVSESKYEPVLIPTATTAAPKKAPAKMAPAKKKKYDSSDDDSDDMGDDSNSEVEMISADEEEHDNEAKWVTLKVFTKEEVNGVKRRKMCDGSDGLERKCTYPACVQWGQVDDSNKPMGMVWKGCLECQEADFGGWDENDERFPITEMSEDHKQAILDNCGVKGTVYEMPFSSTVGKRKRDE